MSFRLALLIAFAAAALVTGCFEPSDRATPLRCRTNADCGRDLQCLPDGLCRATEPSGSSGGSAGGTTGHATGSSSGSSSTSTGGSSGTSTGGSTTQINVINASANHAGALDLCTRPTGSADFGSAGVAGGLAYEQVSAFVAIASAATDLRVVAANSGCDASLFDIASVDLTAHSGTTSMVIFDIDSTHLSVALARYKQAASGFSAVTFVDALVPTLANDNTTLLNAFPRLSTATAASQTLAGYPVTLAPFSDHVLLSQSSSATIDFVGFSAPADAILTVILTGNESASDATGPLVLVCNESDPTPSCSTLLPATPQPTFLRFANLSSELNPLSYWVNVDGAGYFAAPVATLSAGQVNGYSELQYSSSLEVCVTTTTAAPSSDCVSSPSYAGSGSANSSPNTYATFQFYGNLATASGVAVFAETPVSTEAWSVSVTSVNRLTNAGALIPGAQISVPAFFGFPLTSPSQIPLWDYNGLTGQSIDYADSASGTFLRFAVPFNYLQGTASTFFFGGDTGQQPYALVCDNDGTLAVDGLSDCVSILGNAAALPAYLRIIDTTDLSDVDFCVSPTVGGSKVLSAFTNAAVANAFFPVPASSTDLYAVTAGDLCDSTALLHVPLPALTAGDYYTLAISGAPTQTTVSQDTLPVQGTAQAIISVADDWHTAHDNSLSFKIGAQAIGGIVDYAAASNTPTLVDDVFTAIDPPSAAATLQITNGGVDGGVFEYTIPTVVLLGGQVYTFFALTDPAPAAVAPLVRLCVVDFVGAYCVQMPLNP